MNALLLSDGVIAAPATKQRYEHTFECHPARWDPYVTRRRAVRLQSLGHLARYPSCNQRSGGSWTLRSLVLGRPELGRRRRPGQRVGLLWCFFPARRSERASRHWVLGPRL